MLGADGQNYHWWSFPAREDLNGGYHLRLGRWRVFWRSRGSRADLAAVRRVFLEDTDDAKMNLFGGRVIWTWRWDSGQRGTGGGHLVLYPLIVEVYRVARRATPAEVEAAAYRS